MRGDALASGGSSAQFPAVQGITHDKWEAMFEGEESTRFRCKHADHKEKGKKLFFDADGGAYCVDCWERRAKK